MAGIPDGNYSLAVIGEAGGSLVVLKIQDGKISGNDTSGASYVGSVYDHDFDHVKIFLEVTLAPNTFGVWGTAPAETHQTRQFNEIIPKSIFSRNAHELPGYGLTVIATQIPDEYGYLADQDGVEQHIALLQNVVSARKR